MTKMETILRTGSGVPCQKISHIPRRDARHTSLRSCPVALLPLRQNLKNLPQPISHGPSAVQCDKPTAIETWTVPQIKLKNPLDGLTLPQKSPLVLPSSSESTTPVLKSAAAISQPNALVDGFAGESTEALVETVTVTPPLVDTPIPNGQPTTSVSSVPIHSVAEPTEVPKKASKARPSSKKNGRDLCILRWLKQVKKDGTTAEFRIYWDALDTQQRNSYESEAVQLVSSNVWVKNTVGAVVDGTLH
ncbi:hypothetical protein C8R48DRAFT_736029 [Suillus tomentosus]|nr:hypothetical protein C8R48DRAFT_736029 [Suillus tomentosus]